MTATAAEASELRIELSKLVRRYGDLGDVDVVHVAVVERMGRPEYRISYRRQHVFETSRRPDPPEPTFNPSGVSVFTVSGATVQHWRDRAKADGVQPIGLAVQRLRLPVVQAAMALGIPHGDLRRLMTLARKDLQGDPAVPVVLGAVNRHLAALQEVRDMLAQLQHKAPGDD